MDKEGVEIKWHSIGKACLRLGIAFGAGFLVIAFLDKIPEFSLLSQNSPWIPKYVGDSIAFAIGLIFIWRVSQGNFRDYGFTLTGRDLKIKVSIVIGILLGLVGILVEHLPQVISGSPLEPAHPYSLSPANILGMLSFQWIFVGIFEETITRGLVQTPLMKDERIEGDCKNIQVGFSHWFSNYSDNIRCGSFWASYVFWRFMDFFAMASCFCCIIRFWLQLCLSRNKKPSRSNLDA